MQLFMLLYSGRNAVVHTCKTFPMCPLWSVGEGTNLKMRIFWKIWCAVFNFFAPQGDPFNIKQSIAAYNSQSFNPFNSQWNLARRRRLKVSLNRPKLVLMR